MLATFVAAFTFACVMPGTEARAFSIASGQWPHVMRPMRSSICRVSFAAGRADGIIGAAVPLDCWGMGTFIAILASFVLRVHATGYSTRSPRTRLHLTGLHLPRSHLAGRLARHGAHLALHHLHVRLHGLHHLHHALHHLHHLALHHGRHHRAV